MGLIDIASTLAQVPLEIKKGMFRAQWTPKTALPPRGGMAARFGDRSAIVFEGQGKWSESMQWQTAMHII